MISPETRALRVSARQLSHFCWAKVAKTNDALPDQIGEGGRGAFGGQLNSLRSDKVCLRIRASAQGPVSRRQ